MHRTLMVAVLALACGPLVAGEAAWIGNQARHALKFAPLGLAYVVALGRD